MLENSADSAKKTHRTTLHPSTALIEHRVLEEVAALLHKHALVFSMTAFVRSTKHS